MKASAVQVIEWNGARLVVKIAGRLYACECLSPLDSVPTGPPKSTRAQRQMYEAGAPWSEHELVRRGLPLYWSRDWLAEQLARHGATGLSRITPYTRSVLTKWKAEHGIEDDLGQRIKAEWESGVHGSHRTVARAMNVSEQRVSEVVGRSSGAHDPEMADRIREVRRLRRKGVRTAAEAQRRLPHLTYAQVRRAWLRAEMPEGD